MILPLLLCSLISLLNPAVAHGIAGLISGVGDLSTLSAIIEQYPAILDALSTANGTFFAPNNDALDAFISAAGGAAAITPDAIQDLIAYHILPLAYAAEALSVAGGRIVDTQLLDSAYANLEGAANVLFTSAYGSTGQETAPSALKVYSGVGEAATITRPDLAFEGGFVHIVDRVLNFPLPCTKTAEAASLTTLFEAIQKTNLTEVVNTTPGFTCFAPTDEAFAAAGIDISKLTDAQIVDALKYHSIVGEVGYSTAFEDGKEYQTLLGVPVTIHKRDGQLFINDVAVQQGNVIMNSGVPHVLSGVLTPPAGATTAGGGSGTATSTSPASTGTAAGSTSAGSGAMSLRITGFSSSDLVALLLGLYFTFA